MPKVFLDASVLFSAIYSPTGGSHQICQLIKEKKIKGFTSQTVIKELQANISKFNKKTKILPENFIAANKFIVRTEITEKEIKPYLKVVVEKDAHILAAAILCKCDYLLILDKKHIDNASVKNNFTEAIIASPKKFLEYFKK